MENIRVVSLKAATVVCVITSSVLAGIGVVCPQVAQADSSTITLVGQTELLPLSRESLDFPKGYTPPNNGKPKNGRGAGTRT